LQNVEIAAELPAAAQNVADAEQQRRTIVDDVDHSVLQATKDELSHLVDEYQDIFSYSEYDLGSTDLVMHEINTTANPPLKQPLRPQPRARLPAIDNLITEMQNQGVIEPCQSEWASNIVLAPRKTVAYVFVLTIEN